MNVEISNPTDEQVTEGDLGLRAQAAFEAGINQERDERKKRHVVTKFHRNDKGELVGAERLEA